MSRQIFQIYFLSVDGIPSDVPVGTILSWVLRVDDAGGEIVDLPDGWMRCDGSVIPHGSIWTGKNVPNLNGERRFLRGGNDEDMLKLEEDQMQDHIHDFEDPGHGHAQNQCFRAYFKGGGTTEAFSNYHCNGATYPTYSSQTGLSMGGVSSDYRRGAETQPRNMNVIFIIRVW